MWFLTAPGDRVLSLQLAVSDGFHAPRFFARVLRHGGVPTFLRGKNQTLLHNFTQQ